MIGDILYKRLNKFQVMAIQKMNQNAGGLGIIEGKKVEKSAWIETLMLNLHCNNNEKKQKQEDHEVLTGSPELWDCHKAGNHVV